LGQFFQENMENNPTDRTGYLHNVRTKEDVYYLYKQSCPFRGEGPHRYKECVSKQHMNLLWRRYYRQVYCSIKHGFGKCNMCVLLEGLEKKAASEQEWGAQLAACVLSSLLP
jgi:hypothetical protein